MLVGRSGKGQTERNVHQRAIIQMTGRLPGASKNAIALPATATSETIEHYPLSPLQHGMLFHYVQSGRETGVDIEQLEAHLHEPIREQAFSQAWGAIADHHPVLRTRFRWEGLDAPRQEVLA